jgi:hypothetical protein
MKAEKTEKKEEKPKLEIPVEKRALGEKLPPGNCTIISAKSDGSRLPENLRKVWERVEGKGKDGIKLNVLCPKDAAGRYTRWLVRTLAKLGYLKAIPEPKEEKSEKKASKKSTKDGSIAKAVKNRAKNANLRKAA